MQNSYMNISPFRDEDEIDLIACSLNDLKNDLKPGQDQEESL